MSGVRLSRILLAASVFFLAIGIGFRAFIYTKLYIAPTEPYGISDLIEFLLGSLLLVAFGLSALAAVVLAIRGPRANRVAAAWLTIAVVVMAALLNPLHTFAAQWSGR